MININTFNLHVCIIQRQQENITMFGGRGVLLIRNPYHAIISYWNFKETNSHVDITKKSVHSKEFETFAKAEVTKWLKIITDWLQFSNDLYCVFYEVRGHTAIHTKFPHLLHVLVGTKSCMLKKVRSFFQYCSPPNSFRIPQCPTFEFCIS